MAFLNFGVANGLAYRHNFGADRAMLLQEEAIANNQKDAADKRNMLYGEKMKRAVGTTPYFSKQINGLADNNTKQMGILLGKNGNNPAANPMVWAEFSRLGDEMTNNQYTIANKYYEEQSKQFDDFLAKYPGMTTNPKVKKMITDREQFRENGVITEFDGLGNPIMEKDRFQFTNPLQALDLHKEASEFMKAKTGSEIFYTATDSKGHYGAYMKQNAAELNKSAIEFLSDPTRFAAANEEFMLPENTKLREQYYGSLEEYVKGNYLGDKLINQSDILYDNQYTPRTSRTTTTPNVLSTKPMIFNVFQDAKVSATKTAPLDPLGTPTLWGTSTPDEQKGAYIVSGPMELPNGRHLDAKGIPLTPGSELKFINDSVAETDATAWLTLPEFEQYMGVKPWQGYGKPNLVTWEAQYLTPNDKFGGVLGIGANTHEENLAEYDAKGYGRAGHMMLTQAGIDSGYVAHPMHGERPVNMIGVTVKKQFDPRPNNGGLVAAYNNAIGVNQNKSNDYFETGWVTAGGAAFTEMDVQNNLNAIPGSTREEVINALKALK